jgi:hypothetical protein
LTGVEVVGAAVVAAAVEVVCDGVLAVEPVVVGVLAVLDVFEELAGAALDELFEEPQPASAIAIAVRAGSAYRNEAIRAANGSGAGRAVRLPLQASGTLWTLGVPRLSALTALSADRSQR